MTLSLSVLWSVREGLKLSKLKQHSQHNAIYRPECIENSGQFDSDVTAPDDNRLGRQILELEEAVGGDAEIGAGNIGRHRRSSADGDQDV